MRDDTNVGCCGTAAAARSQVRNVKQAHHGVIFARGEDDAVCRYKRREGNREAQAWVDVWPYKVSGIGVYEGFGCSHRRIRSSNLELLLKSRQ